MRKSLVVLTLALAFASLSAPAFASYTVNWIDGFEAYNPGPLHGQGYWVSTTPATSPVVTGVPPIYGGNKSARQVNGVSGAAADLRHRNPTYSAYQRGYAKFWVYDPGDVTGLTTDGKAGVFSSAGADSVGKMFTAGVNSFRSHDYWNIQWSYSTVNADGAGAPSGTGYSFTPGLPAHRIYNAWSYVIITWNFAYTNPDKSAGSALIKWYVNQSGTTPNVTLNFDSTSVRWTNCHDIAGVFIGSLYSQSNPTTFDNTEFHVVPEPSSFVALGGGMIGLLGLIRRRR